MKFAQFIFPFSLLWLCSCDQLNDERKQFHDQNKTLNLQKEEISQKNEVELSKPQTPDDNNSLALITKSIPQPPSLPLPPNPKPPSKPVQPEFTQELLLAVNHWKSIPKSVFPLSSVTIKDTVEFIAKSASGEIIARAQKQAGEEVVAVGVIGEELILSPSKNGKMRGKISISQTDFKEGVAYLFELRKKQRADYAQRVASLSKNPNPVNTDNNRDSKNADESLFEDLPIPGDFGHGKFCICSDCREKRLAGTGTIK